ncbi:C6 zinc finger domain-containing protein [Diaporthe sp. PMI_573]|nr:C6 zinc finger domain-containing protein [Diaporthaceae sp. PMI_573]
MKRRRKHTKSRTGCSECKRRKVKCDESHPVCFNCTRYAATCSFESAPRPSRPSPNNPGLAHTPVNHLPSFWAEGSYLSNTDAAASWDVTFSNIGRPFGGRTPSLHPPNPDPDPWSRDAELMHHWCTVTADTLAAGPDLRHVWRAVIPREGYENRFVMHGVLALSAMHKAYMAPSQADTYLDISARHQVLGSEGFRALLCDVTSENWRPVFCFASVLVAYILCLPVRSPNGNLQTPILSLLDLISCMAGVQVSVKPFLELVTPSEFYSTVRGLEEAISDTAQGKPFPSLAHSLLPADTFDAFSNLRLFFEAELAPGDQKPYLDAVEKLESAARLVARAGLDTEVGTTLFWVSDVHESIISDTRTFKYPALVLMAHFAVFMATLEKTFWHTRGWAKAVVRDVSNHLAGQPRLADVLKWPEKKVWELAL